MKCVADSRLICDHYGHASVAAIVCVAVKTCGRYGLWPF